MHAQNLMHKHLQIVMHRIGRRGAALLFFAFLDLVYSYSLADPSPEARRTSLLAYMETVAPLWAWAGAWFATGIICGVGAFVRHDRFAFAVAMGMKVLFGLTALSGWLTVGLDRGYVAAAIWLVLAAWIYIISTWPEPSALDAAVYHHLRHHPDTDPEVEAGDRP